MTMPVGTPPEGAYVVGGLRGAQTLTEEKIRDQFRGPALSGFARGQQNLHGSNGFLGMLIGALTGGRFFNLGGASTYASEQAAIANDHSKSISDLQAVINALILQGNSTKYVANSTYLPSPGIVSVDVIILGAGAGGGGGSFDAIQYGTQGGNGGGGGGEVHYSIPSNLLPKNADGSFAPIEITIGAGGAGASGDGGTGSGGGNTSFGGLLTAGGGVGGTRGAASPSPGGAGMIPGGRGGTAGYGGSTATPVPGQLPGNSTSAFDLHGGGGGGGAGQGHTGGQNGGIGGVSAGGSWGNPARKGDDPSSIVATGGGGGGGGSWGLNGFSVTPGAAGGYPSGGGGGGGCGRSGAGGGAGGNGMLFVIERFA